jgi:hypothetical protein
MIIPRIKYERSYNYQVENMYKNASETELLYFIRRDQAIWDLIYRFHIRERQMSDAFLTEVKEKIDWSIVLKHQRISVMVWEECRSYIEEIVEYILSQYTN